MVRKRQRKLVQTDDAKKEREEKILAAIREKEASERPILPPGQRIFSVPVRTFHSPRKKKDRSGDSLKVSPKRPPSQKLSAEEIKARREARRKRRIERRARKHTDHKTGDKFGSRADPNIDGIKHREREERHAERLHEAEKFIEAITSCSFADLLARWKKNAPKCGAPNPATRKLAFLLVHAVEAEWNRRFRHSKPSEYFVWPTTNVGLDRGGAFSASGWEKDGLLSYIGYTVRSGSPLGDDDRQGILSRIFEGHLPPLNSSTYMSEWGSPESALRLEKLAQCLASFARQAKRRTDANMSRAVAQWEADLSFLHDTYYVRRFRFAWPRPA